MINSIKKAFAAILVLAMVFCLLVPCAAADDGTAQLDSMFQTILNVFDGTPSRMSCNATIKPRLTGAGFVKSSLLRASKITLMADTSPEKSIISLSASVLGIKVTGSVDFTPLGTGIYCPRLDSSYYVLTPEVFRTLMNEYGGNEAVRELRGMDTYSVLRMAEEAVGLESGCIGITCKFTSPSKAKYPDASPVIIDSVEEAEAVLEGMLNGITALIP